MLRLRAHEPSSESGGGPKTLTGCYYGSARPAQDFPRLIGLYRGGRLKLDELITRRYAINQAPEAFAELAQLEQNRGFM